MSSSVNSEGYLANNVEEIINNSDLMNDVHIGRKFNLFQEVQDLLSKLKAFNHPMRMFNSQSIEDYNRCAKAKEPLEPIDGKWKFAYYVIACVHFGQPWKRSNRIRCNQRHLAIQCTAKITISYDREFKCLVLKHCTLEHNHRISSEIMKHYASNRRLSIQEQHELDEVLQLRPNNKQLKEFIQAKYKKLVTLKDIQNLKLLMKQTKAGGRSDKQVLIDLLENTLEKNTGAKGFITVNQNNEIAIV